MEETKLPGGDAVDDGDENGGEERGDVDDEDLFSERPGKQKQEGDVDFYFVGSLVYSSLLVFTNFYFWFDLMLSNFKTCKLTR